MSMNFLLQLSDEELLKLHRYAVCDDIEDELDKTIDYISGRLNITFYENWPEEDGTASYIETNYTYDDFNGITSHETFGEETYLFKLFMIERFGYDYIQQLVQHKFGIDKYWFDKAISKKQ